MTHNLIEFTPTEEYVSVMDNMIIQFKSIEDWGELPIGFYGARLLAKADDKCKSIFLSYLKMHSPIDFDKTDENSRHLNLQKSLKPRYMPRIKHIKTLSEFDTAIRVSSGFHAITVSPAPKINVFVSIIS